MIYFIVTAVNKFYDICISQAGLPPIKVGYTSYNVYNRNPFEFPHGVKK